MFIHCFFREKQMHKPTKNKDILNTLFIIQGGYFVVTGVWPMINIESFIIATGPKQEIWLVQMIGLLSISIGLTFLQSALRRRPLPFFLGYTVSFSFLIMDIVCVVRGIIDQIYLLDAVIQLLFLILLTVFLYNMQRQTKQ